MRGKRGGSGRSQAYEVDLTDGEDEHANIANSRNHENFR